MRTLLHALRPGGRLVVHVPGTSADGSFGRRVNFDVPGHVRPGYRAEELVGKLAGRRLRRDQRTSYTYGPLETFTNNISYLITGADQRNKAVYAAVFPVLLAVSYLGQVLPPALGRRCPGRRPASGATPPRRGVA